MTGVEIARKRDGTGYLIFVDGYQWGNPHPTIEEAREAIRQSQTFGPDAPGDMRLVLAGFADCEGLILAMIDAFHGKIEAGNYPPGLSPKAAALWAVDGIALAVSLGQHRDATYGEVAAVHRAVVNRAIAHKGGKAKSEAKARASRVNGAKGGRPPRKKEA